MNWLADSDYSAPCGMVSLRPGDVLLVTGARCMAVMVNDCRARVEPLDRVRREVVARFGEPGDKIAFDAQGRSANVAVHCEPGDILERRGAEGVKEFIAARKARRGKAVETGAETITNDGEENNIMAAKQRKLKGEKKTTKARGGLAADAAAGAEAEAKADAKAAAAQAKLDAKAQKDQAKADAKLAKEQKKASKEETAVRTGGKRGVDSLFGYSASAVLRAMGAKGVKTDHAMAIMQARGVTSNKVTVGTLLSDGRSGKYGSPAPLTNEQFKELVSAAQEPVKESTAGKK